MSEIEKWRELVKQYKATDEFGYAKAFTTSLSDACDRVEELERDNRTLFDASLALSDGLNKADERISLLLGTLEIIANAGSDCPAGMTEAEFNEGQFRRQRFIARKAFEDVVKPTTSPPPQSPPSETD